MRVCESAAFTFGPSLGTWGKVTVELPKHIEVNQCRPRWSAQWSCLPSPDTLQLVFPRNWESNKNISEEHLSSSGLSNLWSFLFWITIPSFYFQLFQAPPQTAEYRKCNDPWAHMNSALLIFDEIELPFHGILKPMTLWEQYYTYTSPCLLMPSSQNRVPDSFNLSSKDLVPAGGKPTRFLTEEQ